MASSFTTTASVLNFWPDAASEIPPEQLEVQLGNYVLRASFLIAKLGPIDVGQQDAPQLLELAANMLVKRLFYRDNHPATSASAANVTRESGGGFSYARGGKETLQDIVGDEILAYLQNVVSISADAVTMTAEQVFASPVLAAHDTRGNVIKIFDPVLDDSLNELNHANRLWRIRMKRGTV